MYKGVKEQTPRNRNEWKVSLKEVVRKGCEQLNTPKTECDSKILQNK